MDLDRAEQLSSSAALALDRETANSERAAMFQALGRYDEALSLREAAAQRDASFENLAALVGLHAERGELEAAERQDAAITRRVSPFPLALLDFQMGLMWMNEGRLDDARRSFEAVAGFAGTRAVTTNPGTGAGRLRRAPTSWSRVT